MPTGTENQQTTHNGQPAESKAAESKAAEPKAENKPEEKRGEKQEEGKQEQGKQEEEKHEEPAPPPDPAKRRRFLIIGLVVGAVVLCLGVYFYLHSKTYENTDNAQVDGHLNPISSRLAGTVKAVYAEDNQRVEAGQLLIELDTTDIELALAQSQADYHEAVAQQKGEQPNLSITTTSNRAQAATGQADVADAAATVAAAQHDYQSDIASLQEAEANNIKAQTDLKRYKQLLDKHEVAAVEYDQYEAAARAQAAVVEARRAKAASSAKIIDQRKAQLSQKQAALQQTVENAPREVEIRNADLAARRAKAESAAAQVRQQEMNLTYCRIVAPAAGIVSQRTGEVGSRISVGQQLMMIVQTNDLWVTANFKETQLKKVRPGQGVTIHVDSLDRDFEGFVESMPASTGDRTSALPPENATGNFVKVVQRMPVRIRFRPNQQGMNELRPGMSVEPKIHF